MARRTICLLREFSRYVIIGGLAMAAPAQTVTPVSATLARTGGVDAGTSTAYTRLFLTTESQALPDFRIESPTLTVQCSKPADGKYRVELLINTGGVTDATFYPPWKASGSDLFPPRTEKLTVTMEYLGYTHVKPVRRQFERVEMPVGQMRYVPPGNGSSNLEEVATTFQYLKALPTLRLTFAGQTITFQTEPLLAQMRKEPICQASHL